MNIFNKVTLQSLKKNRTRTIVTIIGIMLSASMICAVTTTISSFQNYMLENEIYNEGDWHGQTSGVDYKTYEDIGSSEEVDSAVFSQQLGYARADGSQNEYKPYLYVIGAGENFEKVMPIHITSGRYPKSEDEILLPLHLSDNGGVKYDLGDTLTLELGERMFEGDALGQNNPCYTYSDNNMTVLLDEEIVVRETRAYTVVGFYERPNFEEYSAPGYTAITLSDNKNQEKYKYDVYFKMNNPKEVFQYMDGHSLEGISNTDVLMYSGVAYYRSFYRVLYSLAAIIIGLIMFGSVSLIYNAFSISVSERTKQFGLLSSVGATKKQVRRMVLFEALVVSLIGIPLGIAVGIGGIGITLLLIGQKFTAIMGNPIAMRLCVSPIAILTACIVALVTVLISAWIPSKRATKVSAIEAIRQSSDIKMGKKPVKTARFVYRLFGLPGMLASKHYKRNRRKYRATVISLFMSIVLFVSASSFTDYLTKSVEGVFTENRYDLRFYYDDYDFVNITKEELLKKIQKSAGVTDAIYMEGSYYDGEVDESYITKEVAEQLKKLRNDDGDETMPAIDTFVYFINDAAFKELLQTYDLDEKEFMDKEAPLGIVADGSKVFDSDEQKYITIKYLNSDRCKIQINGAKEIEGYYRAHSYEDEDGNMICHYVNRSDSNDTLDIPEEEACIPYTLNTGKTIDELPYYAVQTGIVILYPQSMREAVCPGMEKQGGYYYMTSDNHNESYLAVKKTLEENGMRGEELFDYAARVEEERNMITIIRVFAYGFIVLISLIAAANVFNTISTNISLRRREFAMLKSVGMTESGFNRMMNFECLLYGSKALLYGLPVSALVAFLIYRAISEGYSTNFRLPWSAIGLAVLSVFVVVFATMMYAMAKIKKENPIDALKNENI